MDDPFSANVKEKYHPKVEQREICTTFHRRDTSKYPVALELIRKPLFMIPQSTRITTRPNFPPPFSSTSFFYFIEPRTEAIRNGNSFRNADQLMEPCRSNSNQTKLINEPWKLKIRGLEIVERFACSWTMWRPILCSSFTNIEIFSDIEHMFAYGKSAVSTSYIECISCFRCSSFH